MNNAFDSLPWLLAAAAAVLVGAISAMAADGDVWVILARSGIAFVAFWLLGALARLFLSRTARSSPKVIGGKKASPRRLETSEPSGDAAQKDAAIPGEE